MQTDRTITMHPAAAKLTHGRSVCLTQLHNPWPTYCIWMRLCLVHWSPFELLLYCRHTKISWVHRKVPLTVREITLVGLNLLLSNVVKAVFVNVGVFFPFWGTVRLFLKVLQKLCHVYFMCITYFLKFIITTEHFLHWKLTFVCRYCCVLHSHQGQNRKTCYQCRTCWHLYYPAHFCKSKNTFSCQGQ